MPRYEARAEVHGEPAWAIFDHGVARYSLTEADAHIIAWSLNQVAEDRLIVSLASPQELAPAGTRYAGYYCIDYTGPTDGVAPPSEPSQTMGEPA